MARSARVVSIVLASCVYSFAASLRFVPVVEAAVAACNVTVSPTSVTTNSSTNFTITIENTDSSSYAWMEITRPSSDFTITGGGASGWGFSASESTVTLTGGTLGNGSSTNITVSAQVKSADEATHNWAVMVSDDSGGASPYTCTGTLTAQISGSGTDTYEPAISGITVSGVSDHDATISWSTDEAANSVVQYGTTSSYGSTVTETALVTSHEVIIPSLTKDTTYHFKVQSTDAAGNVGESGDNTFVTSLIQETVTITNTTTTTVTKEVIVEVEVLVEDTTPPVPSITTDLSLPFLSRPVIEGTVTDNTGVLLVEYSTDAGRNYLPVDFISDPEAQSTSYSFSPLGLLDGNYSVKVRATDIAGNVAETEIATLVFDRLPPQVGTTVISMGPQIFLPQSGGQIVTLPGLEQRITADAIGGPISIGLVVQKTDSSAALGMTRGVLASESQLFALTKNTDSGLWFGAMSFEAPGTYDVIAMALDGADNRTERVLSQVVVVSPGAVLYGGSGVNSAVVSAYVFDPDLQRFVVWGGEGFGQENPQTVDSNGNYRLILPKGKYYLEVSAPGFRVLRSSVFELDDSLPITWDFVLERDLSRIGGKLPFGLGALFDQLLEVEVVYTELEMGENGLVGQELPVFTLYPSTSLRVENAGAFSNFDLRGKPTLLTVLNTWHPRASEQAAVLNTLAADSSLNIVVLVPQESESGVEVYRNRGGYTDLQFVADPDGSLIEPLGISASPTHYFMDRKGVITSVQVGTLDRNGVLEGLFQ